MKKILIVDGFPFVRELLAEELTAAGNVVIAIGKPELIGSLINLFAPDLIILDLYMNGKMRWKVLREIKAQFPKLPVFIFTAYYPEGDPRLFQADGWVIKSSVFDELKRKINEIPGKKAINQNEPKSLIPMYAKQLSP